MRGRVIILWALLLVLNAAPAQANYWEGHEAFRRGDYETARREFSRLAEQGHAASQFNLAYLYQHGLSVQRDPAVAVSWYLEAARQGRVEAQFSLGALYETGTGVARNPVLAYRWYNLAASNVPPGQSRDRLIKHRERITGKLSAGQLDAVESAPAPVGFALGAALAKSQSAKLPAPTVSDVQQALAARRFNPGPIDGRMGKSTIGALSAFQASKGLVVSGETDGPTLQELFGPEEVAPHLEPFPRTALARSEPAPPAVPVPPVEALQLEAPPAQVAEAPAAKDSEVAPPPAPPDPKPATSARPQERPDTDPDDPAAAAVELRRLAERGNLTAQVNLATMYHYGQGVPEDHAEAVKWYSRAAEQGRVDAMFPLGSLYESGAPEQRDLVKAYGWYKRAAELVPHGKAHQIISGRRDRVAKRLSSAQLAAADRAPEATGEREDTASAPIARRDNRPPSDATVKTSQGGPTDQVAVAEGAADGTVLGLVRGADPDADEVLRYDLVEDAAGRFAIDAVSGTLAVRDGGRLDHETAERHQVVVRVRDAQGLSHEQAITILVEDRNEAPTGDGLQLTVAENTGPGTRLGRLTVLDPDNGKNGELSFELVGDPPFAVDPADGTLAVADGGVLDFETQDRYDLTATVRDGGGLSLSIPVTVTLSDRNEAPVGLKMAAGGTVSEQVKAGTFVGRVQASDPDAGDRLVYSLVDDADGRFALDPETGAITVADGSDLDFETAIQRFDFDPGSGLIVATDGPNGVVGEVLGHKLLVRVADAEGLSQEASLAVQVIDVNESPWARDADYDLRENTPAGTAVGRIEAGDPDRGTYGRLRFALGEGQDRSFAIDPASGEITVADGAALDFEARQTLKLTVVITDGGGLSASAPLAITLLDINEAPSALDVVGGTVSETAQAGTKVATVLAHDPDAEDRLTYSLSDDAGGRFAVDSETGAVTLTETAVLDFGLAASHDIVVEVSDAAGLTYNESLSIRVADANRAPNELLLSDGAVQEDAEPGRLVAKVLASDPDADERLTYRLLDDADGRFVIDPETGHVSVGPDPRLDYETVASHRLTVQVVDSGGLTRDEVLTVLVRDVNEAPRALAGSFRLDEAAEPGTKVGRLRAGDPDSGANGTLRYAVTGDNSDGRFTIDPATGVLTVADGASFDYEDRRSFKLVVAATDGGGLMDSALLEIDLTDRNEPPAGLRLMAGQVPENAASGRDAGQILALDPDAGDTLAYTLIEDAGGRFAIDSETGAITVADAARLDFETGPTHRLTVRVSDAGGLSHQDSVVIALTDTNEPPTATAGGLAVDETAPPGTPVGRISASDPDDGDRLTFALADDGEGRFAIDAETGEIAVAGGAHLDYETADRHQIVAVVTDSGGLSDQVSATVKLTDRNEPPGGSVATQGMVAESAEAGTLAAVYAGRDPDAGDRLTYSLANDAGGRFAVDPARGLITVARPAKLDYEAATLHRVVVRATDSGGLMHEDTIAIAVLDVDETGGIAGLAALKDADAAKPRETETDADRTADRRPGTNGLAENGHSENGHGEHGHAMAQRVAATVGDDTGHTSEAVLLEAALAAAKMPHGPGHAILGQAARIKAAQAQLAEAGFDPGPVDGKMGPRTRAALRDYQEAFQLNDLAHDALLDHLLVRTHFRRAYDYQRQGDYDKSIGEYSEVIRLSPGHFGAHYNRGLAHYAKRSFGPATEDFEAVIEAWPDYAGAFVNRGNAYYHQGFYVRAVRDYATALRLWITPW